MADHRTRAAGTAADTYSDGTGSEVVTDKKDDKHAGTYLPAALVGALATFGLLAIPGRLTGGLGNFFYPGPDEGFISGWEFLGAALILFGALFVGGWVAGRVARRDGGWNGTLAGVTYASIAALGAYIGSQIVDVNELALSTAPPAYLAVPPTLGWTLAAILVLSIGILCSTLGGKVGERSLYNTVSERATVKQRGTVTTGAGVFNKNRATAGNRARI